MYKIYSGSKLVGTVDSIVYIQLGKNGCYKRAALGQAEGICVKLPKTYVDEETKEEIKTIEDTVFALQKGGLKGTEPVARVKAV